MAIKPLDQILKLVMASDPDVESYVGIAVRNDKKVNSFGEWQSDCDDIPQFT